MLIRSFLILQFTFIFIMRLAGQDIQTSPFDRNLQQLTDVIATKLQPHHQQKIAVWDLSELNGDVSPIGKYIAEDISINLSDKFHIVNRNQLNTILKENQLKTEGFINQATMKQIKKLSDIDILLTGTVSVLADHIKVTLQALDADGNIIAAAKGEIPMNADVKELLGINTGSTNRGFNRPLNSNEQVNNPATVNSDCEAKNIGDYCFRNSTSKSIYIQYQTDPNNAGSMTLAPGQTQCTYNRRAGIYFYTVKLENPNFPGVFLWDSYANGEIKIESCKSNTFNVR